MADACLTRSSILGQGLSVGGACLSDQDGSTSSSRALRRESDARQKPARAEESLRAK